MRRTPLVLLALDIVMFAGVPSARADELVEVAQQRGTVVPSLGQPTPPLLGYLTRPKGRGRFPAVVLLHGCPGFSLHDPAFAATLRSWGYVGLALDSLGPASACGGSEAAGAAAEMLDAYAALRYLAAQSFVAGSRVGIMGWSMGGSAALAVVEKGAIRPADGGSFAAAIAYYPSCGGSSGILTTPALILIGERDDWTAVEPCRKLAAHESDLGILRDAAEGTPIDLVVYPNVSHGFDYHIPTQRYMGHLIRYDEAAARDAEDKVRSFLRRVLGDQPDSP